MPRKLAKCMMSLVWKPLNSESLKVNMNGSFLRSSGREGIGGPIRDSDGRVFIQFYKEVREDSTINAEVLALREGLLFVAVSRWASSHYFLFESDIQLVVSAPWR